MNVLPEENPLSIIFNENHDGSRRVAGRVDESNACTPDITRGVIPGKDYIHRHGKVCLPVPACSRHALGPWYALDRGHVRLVGYDDDFFFYRFQLACRARVVIMRVGEHKVGN